MKEPIPGLYLALEDASSLAPWSESGAGIKRRHFVIEGQTLKLFGRRGKTYKGHLNLLAVTALKPASDASAPHGALEIHVRASRTRQQTCILAPDHSAEELFMELGNAVPSHVISADLWRRYMGSRPAITTDAAPREYRVGKTLGTGTFGKVKLAERADGAIFAIKCLNRSRIVMASQGCRLAKEIRLLKMLNHPNVIRLHEVLHTPTEILMVMEYVDGGDLLEVLNTRSRFSEGEVRHIFCQICSGVSFCHSLGVAHRDLKPENILIGKRAADGTYLIKVADFGLSTLMRADQLLSTACGSPHYVAPEILTFDGGAAYDGLVSDVWSLGVLLHVMLLYKLPFEAESTQLLYKKIRQGLAGLPEGLPPPAASLLHGMLTVDPAKRITLVQVAQHEWLQLQGGAPVVLSQTVDASVHFSGREGSESFLSATNLFMLGSDTSVDGESASATGLTPLRRAFTFDALPSGSDDNCDDLFEPPRHAENAHAAGRAAHSRRHGLFQPGAIPASKAGALHVRPVSPRDSWAVASPSRSPRGSPRDSPRDSLSLSPRGHAVDTPRATGRDGDSSVNTSSQPPTSGDEMQGGSASGSEDAGMDSAP